MTDKGRGATDIIIEQLSHDAKIQQEAEQVAREEAIADSTVLTSQIIEKIHADAKIDRRIATAAMIFAGLAFLDVPAKAVLLVLLAFALIAGVVIFFS